LISTSYQLAPLLTDNLKSKYLYKETIINYIKNNVINRKKDILINNSELKISLTTIGRIIQMAGYSYKNIKNTVCPYSKEILDNKRIEFSQNVDTSEYMDYISIDETSFCINDYCKKSYSIKGTKVENIMKHQRIRERYTLLLAISNNDLIAYRLFSGSLNLEIYKSFIYDNKENHEKLY